MSKTDYSFVTEIRMRLALIEETLKRPLSVLAATLDNVKKQLRTRSAKQKKH
ncbi:MAG: hypothetical protein ACQEXX_21200 [Bacillota bacterium]